jgi:cobalt-zinc-cadmium resistance protein CzcA
VERYVTFGRGRHERSSRHRRDSIDLALRALGGDRGVQGRRRRLLRASARIERLSSAREAIPPGFGTPELGPVTTGLGEVYQFVIRGPYSPMELKEILEWQIAYRLRSVPGVTEVSGEGGFIKQYQVVVDPAKLVAYRLSIGQVFRALEENNAVGGGGYIEKGGEAYLVRGEGLVEDAAGIKAIVVATSPEGVPITIQQLGTVRVGAPPRIGAATRDGEGEAVIAMTLMLKGANARAVAEQVKAELARMLPSLPAGIVIEPFYDRARLVDQVIHTVGKNLAEGGLLVIAVLFLLLGNLRGSLIVASAIPPSMLIAFTGMVYAGISGNLMSLGAIDFGLIVDGAVVMIENIIRRKAASAAHQDHPTSSGTRRPRWRGRSRSRSASSSWSTSRS